MFCQSTTKSRFLEIIAELAEWLGSPGSSWSCTSNTDLPAALILKVTMWDKNDHYFVNTKIFQLFNSGNRWFGKGSTPSGKITSLILDLPNNDDKIKFTHRINEAEENDRS